MDLGLRDKVAFVAGASSGLGKAVATSLAREGARVAICSRDRERIDAAAADIVATTGNGTILPVTCDVTSESDIADAINHTVDQLGGLNAIVTNAGGPPTGMIDDIDAEQWRSAMDLNLISTINLCRHAIPHLRDAAEAGLARILMITSISAKQPIPGLYLSNTARAGVQGFAKSLSEELGADGITVNTILPGYTRTARLSHLSEALQARNGGSIEDIEAGWASGSALKRIGTEEEFAATATFLLSKPAGFITGVALCVDGGTSKTLL